MTYEGTKILLFFIDWRVKKWDIHAVMRTPFTTTITREILDPKQDWESVGEIEIDVEGTYYHGCPAKGPSYASGGEPEEHPEVEITLSSYKGEWIDLTASEEEEIEEKILNNPPCDDQGYED